MSGYLDFRYTDCKPVDDILWALERAGSAYHHTDSWGDAAYDGGPSEMQKIQDAANAAAASLAAAQAELAGVRGELATADRMREEATAEADAMQAERDQARAERDAAKQEAADYLDTVQMLERHCSTVYEYMTRGMVTKANTLPDVVIALHEDKETEAEEARQKEQRDEYVPSILRAIVAAVGEDWGDHWESSWQDTIAMVAEHLKEAEAARDRAVAEVGRLTAAIHRALCYIGHQEEPGEVCTPDCTGCPPDDILRAALSPTSTATGRGSE